MASRRTPDPSRPPEIVPAAPVRRVLRAPTAATAAPPANVSPESRREMIAERAYLRAERRGFTPGRETEDWLAAEIEVDALLKVSSGGAPQ
ncbi:MAG TPA: DUF2934 domain-containing protein [Steroidobacteraceae bacterium]|nr:DUF2934 domain-containing protein [Steroidobacteraceae bacterium]